VQAYHGGDRTVALQGEWHVQPPALARVVTTMASAGAQDSRTLVLNGPEGWAKRGTADAQALDLGFYAEEREQFYLYWLARLAPLKLPALAARVA